MDLHGINPESYQNNYQTVITPAYLYCKQCKTNTDSSFQIVDFIFLANYIFIFLSFFCNQSKNHLDLLLIMFICFFQVFGRSQSMPGTETMLTKPVEKQHTDTVVNFLIRIACQVTPPPSPLHTQHFISLTHTHTHIYAGTILPSTACQVGHNSSNPSVVKVGHTWWVSWTHRHTHTYFTLHTAVPWSSGMWWPWFQAQNRLLRFHSPWLFLLFFWGQISFSLFIQASLPLYNWRGSVTAHRTVYGNIILSLYSTW